MLLLSAVAVFTLISTDEVRSNAYVGYPTHSHQQHTHFSRVNNTPNLGHSNTNDRIYKKQIETKVRGCDGDSGGTAPVTV